MRWSKPHCAIRVFCTGLLIWWPAIEIGCQLVTTEAIGYRFLSSARVREPLWKKIRDFLGVFPKCRTPRPTIWGASVQKIFKGLFCVFGPKEHFWFLQKFSLFVNILTYTFGNRGPPPPSRKNSQIILFLPDFFPDLTDQDPKSNYLKVIKLIRYHLPLL